MPDIKTSLFALIRAALPRIDYYALFYGKVVAWNGDPSVQTVDVQPNDPRLPTMASIPLRGPAGVTWNIDPSTETSVLVGWENGDPSRPFALCLFSLGAHVQGVTLNADQIILGGTDGAEPAAKGQSLNNALISDLLSVLVTSCTGVATLPQVAAAINAIGPAAQALIKDLPGVLASNVQVK